MLDRYNRLPYDCQSKIGYDFLIENLILEVNKHNEPNNNRYRYRIKNENW